MRNRMWRRQAGTARYRNRFTFKAQGAYSQIAINKCQARTHKGDALRLAGPARAHLAKGIKPECQSPVRSITGCQDGHISFNGLVVRELYLECSIAPRDPCHPVPDAQGLCVRMFASRLGETLADIALNVAAREICVFDAFSILQSVDGGASPFDKVRRVVSKHRKL